MDARRMLEWIWQPRADSPVSYMGLQCLAGDKLAEGSQNDVYGFKGYDAEGIPWQTFFDQKTKQPIIGFSGDGDPESGATQIEFRVDQYKIVSAFNINDDFYPMECVQDYNFEGIPQSMMPTADFGLFVL